MAGTRLVGAERAAHLVAVDVRGLGRLLDVHPELDDVEEELQQVLVLGVAALDGEGQVRLAVLQRERRRQRHARLLAGREHVVGVLPLVEHEACMRWLRPMPVRPAMTAGIQAPLGVIETTQPSASAAITDVVPDLGGLVAGRRGDGPVVLREAGLLAGHRVPRVEESPERVLCRPGRDRGRRAGRRDRSGPRRIPREALLRVLLREQPRHRLLGREGGVAVVEVAVGEGQAHRLVEGVDVAGRVVPHRLEVGVLEDVERLQHRRPLRPDRELVDVDALVRGPDRLLELHLPAGQVLRGDEPALLLRAADELPGDVAAVEAVVGGVDRLLAALARGEGLSAPRRPACAASPRGPAGRRSRRPPAPRAPRRGAGGRPPGSTASRESRFFSRSSAFASCASIG